MTVIDTPGKIKTLSWNREATSFDPGLGDEVKADRETVEQLVRKLKEEIKHVNAFVILFNGQVIYWQAVKCHSFLLGRVRGSPMV